jgi:hypothetical protein
MMSTLLGGGSTLTSQPGHGASFPLGGANSVQLTSAVTSLGGSGTPSVTTNLDLLIGGQWVTVISTSAQTAVGVASAIVTAEMLQAQGPTLGRVSWTLPTGTTAGLTISVTAL